MNQANFRNAPLALPDLVERQPELLAYHLTEFLRHRQADRRAPDKCAYSCPSRSRATIAAPLRDLNGGWTPDAEHNKPARALGYTRYEQDGEALDCSAEYVRRARGDPPRLTPFA
jgi:hypothetical protein